MPATATATTTAEKPPTVALVLDAPAPAPVFVPVTFTNARHPNEKVFVSKPDAEGVPQPTFKVIEFLATKAVARTALEAENIRRACPYAREEPADANPHVHRKSGFWTHHTDLYDEYVANYEEGRR